SLSRISNPTDTRLGRHDFLWVIGRVFNINELGCIMFNLGLALPNFIAYPCHVAVDFSLLHQGQVPTHGDSDALLFRGSGLIQCHSQL
ncbi:unnamed protein product, partial [Prunus brigantina]